MNKDKIKYALRSSFVGIIAGVCVQYIVEIVIKLMRKRKLIDILKVEGKWQAYYTAGIAGGINGFLLPFIPSNLYPFSSILVVVAIYNTLLVFSDPSEFEKNFSSGNDFVFGIIRDIFLINFIIYVFNIISNFNKKEKKTKRREELSFDSLLSVTIISSIVISLSFNYTQQGINNILGFTNSLDEAITE